MSPVPSANLAGVWLLLWLVLGGCASYRISRLYQKSYLIPHSDEAEQLTTRFLAGHIWVKASIQGKEGWFLWDTGADLTVLDEAWSQALSLKPVARGRVNDAHKRRQELVFCEIDTFSLGQHQVAKVGAVLADLSALEICHIEMAGIIGQTIISRANWAIQFSDSSLYMGNAPFPVQDNATALSIKRRNLTPYLSLDLGGTPKRCKLDYGSTGGLDLPRDDLAAAQLLASEPASRYIGAGRSLFGWAEPDTGYRVQVDSLFLGGLAIPHVEIDLARDTRLKVGTEVLSRYDAVWDRDSLRLWLQEIPGSLVEPDPDEATFGVYVRWVDGTLMVQSVLDLAGTPAASLRPLQTLVHLQGRPGNSFDNHCAFAEWQDSLWGAVDTLYVGIQTDSVIGLTQRVPPKRMYE